MQLPKTGFHLKLSSASDLYKLLFAKGLFPSLIFDPQSIAQNYNFNHTKCELDMDNFNKMIISELQYFCNSIFKY